MIATKCVGDMNEQPEDEERVTCPSCQGAGRLPNRSYDCLCCKGVKTIPLRRYQAILKIRKDLTQRLRERGMLPY